MTGNAPEDVLAAHLQRLEDRLAENPVVERAVLTLSAPGEEPLFPSR